MAPLSLADQNHGVDGHQVARELAGVIGGGQGGPRHAEAAIQIVVMAARGDQTEGARAQSSATSRLAGLILERWMHYRFQLLRGD